jgi:hypothetical protein
VLTPANLVESFLPSDARNESRNVELTQRDYELADILAELANEGASPPPAPSGPSSQPASQPLVIEEALSPTVPAEDSIIEVSQKPTAEQEEEDEIETFEMTQAWDTPHASQIM